MSLDPASSIAGIISLAGLLVQSVTFLYRFCSNLKHIADEVESTVHSIERFQSLLQHIEQILGDGNIIDLQSPSLLNDLAGTIKVCAKDLEIWLQAMEIFHQVEGRSFKKVVRHLKAAADDGRFPKMRIRLAAHQQQLSAHLSVINV